MWPSGASSIDGRNIAVAWRNALTQGENSAKEKSFYEIRLIPPFRHSGGKTVFCQWLRGVCRMLQRPNPPCNAEIATRYSRIESVSLKDLRQRIDEIDCQLVELLNERARVVVEVGNFKSKTDGPIYAPDREKQVLAKITQVNQGPLPDRTLVAIWRELMSGSFVLEKPLRIAYLGPGGSFSHTAAMLKFGQSVEYQPLADIRGIFEEISKGHCDLGIVPIENSSGGGVIETLDALIDSDVKVCAEVLMAIHHNLLANCPLEQI
jgi:chorismate mutase-like protein